MASNRAQELIRIGDVLAFRQYDRTESMTDTQTVAFRKSLKSHSAGTYRVASVLATKLWSTISAALRPLTLGFFAESASMFD